MDGIVRKVIMDNSKNKEHRRNKVRKRNGGISRVSLIGYGALTLMIIWAAAVISIIENKSSFGFWLSPLLITIFLLIVGIVFLRANTEHDY